MRLELVNLVLLLSQIKWGASARCHIGLCSAASIVLNVVFAVDLLLSGGLVLRDADRRALLAYLAHAVGGSASLEPLVCLKLNFLRKMALRQFVHFRLSSVLGSKACSLSWVAIDWRH